ncbi:MAG TPA: hypothetical protein VN905_13815 [Candidatus Binatia bacterium]|nr:hypothetical protein [Candidatus Binatia bacterium]
MFHIVADPDELGQLYQRCARCLYLRYRSQKDVGAPVDTEWAKSVVGYHAEEDWFELRNAPRFRFRSYGEMVESSEVRYAGLDCALSFVGRYDALLELENGTIVLAKCIEHANENASKLHREGLHGYAFALDHPRTENVDPIHVQTLGVLEFRLTPTPRGKNEVHPSRLSLMERNPEWFANWMRVVARLLAGRIPPPQKCRVCEKL